MPKRNRVRKLTNKMLQALNLKRAPLNLRVTSDIVDADPFVLVESPNSVDWEVISTSASPTTTEEPVITPTTRSGLRVRFDLGDGQVIFPESVLDPNEPAGKYAYYGAIEFDSEYEAYSNYDCDGCDQCGYHDSGEFDPLADAYSYEWRDTMEAMLEALLRTTAGPSSRR